MNIIHATNNSGFPVIPDTLKQINTVIDITEPNSSGQK